MGHDHDGVFVLFGKLPQAFEQFHLRADVEMQRRLVEQNEPRLLRFGVTSNPPPMRELSPYGDIDAPHLHGFLVSQRGQFALESLPGGRTRLVGSTWYQHHLWPEAYWRMWSDHIIHTIHLRVLNHVKELSERNEP